MNDNDRKVSVAFSLQQRQVEHIRIVADEQFDGNVSMALRRIIDEWADMRSKQLPLPIPTPEAAR